MNTIEIRADEATEELLQFIIQSIDDPTLDEIDMQREQAAASGLASEPITIAVTLVFLGHLAGTAVTAGAAAAGGEAGRRLTGLLWDRISKWVKRTGQPVAIASGSNEMTITPRTIDGGTAEKEFVTVVSITNENPGLSSD